jgi:hypothetical protein
MAREGWTRKLDIQGYRVLRNCVFHPRLAMQEARPGALVVMRYSWRAFLAI